MSVDVSLAYCPFGFARGAPSSASQHNVAATPSECLTDRWLAPCANTPSHCSVSLLIPEGTFIPRWPSAFQLPLGSYPETLHHAKPVYGISL